MKLIKYRNKEIVLDFVPSVLDEYRKAPFQYFVFLIDTSVPTEGNDLYALEYRVLERDPLYFYRFKHGEEIQDGERYKHGYKDTPGSLKELFITIRNYQTLVKSNRNLKLCAVQVEPPNKVRVVTDELVRRSLENDALFGVPEQQMHVIEDIANYGKTQW